MPDSDPTQFDADELKAALDKLRNGVDLYAVSERVAKIGHYAWNRAQDRLESCSDQYARVFGQDIRSIYAAQASFESLVAQIHPGDRERYLQACRAANPENHLDIEYRVILANGEVRYLREISVYLADDAQSPRGNFGIMQDVSRRVQQRSALARHNELAKQAETMFEIGHYVYDEKNEHYLYVSDGFARIHGTTVDEYMGHAQTFDEDLQQVAKVDRKRVARAYRRYIDTGESLDIEYRITRPDGRQRWVRELNEARSMGQDGVLQTLGVLQDITRQKEIELELRYKDNLAMQAEIITDIGHFVFDEIADRYVYVSPGLARIHGVDVDFLMHSLTSTEQDLQFVHEDDREMVAALYREQAEADETGVDNWELEYRMIRPDGEIRWVREIGKTHVIDAGIEEQTIGVMIDITEQKNAEQEIRAARDKLEQQVVERTRELAATVAQLETEIAERKKLAAELQFLADHDALTGLPSLRLGRDRVQQALTAAHRSEQHTVVMFLDLDGFKQINDAYGHEIGDRVLKIVAGRITSEVREQDTVARIGGDEFLAVLSDIPEFDVAERIAAGVIENVGQDIALENLKLRVGVSIGIALYPENGSSVDELISAADKAMYQVKRRGKNDFGFAGLKSGRKIIDPADPNPEKCVDPGTS